MATRLLLDTHVFLWRQANDAALTTEARDRIATAEVVFVSAASVWEAGIKAALGKLDVPDSITSGVEASGNRQASDDLRPRRVCGGLARASS